MSIKTRLGVMIMGGAMVSGLATTAMAMTSVPSGWYLEANGGSAHLSNKNYASTVYGNSSGIGANANAGYKFMPFLTAEVGYSSYPNNNWKATANDNKLGTEKYYSYQFAFKGIVPIVDSGLEMFAKLGAGHLTSHFSVSNVSAANTAGVSNNTHTATGLFAALGAQYYVMPEIALVGQWAHMKGSSSTGNQDLTSGGVSIIIA